MGQFETLWARIQQEIPGAKIVKRGDSKFLNFIFGLLRNVLQVNTDFSRYNTTIGRTIYVSDNFWNWSDYDRYRLIRHELKHLRSFRNWPIKTLSRPYLWYINAFLMGFCYLFVAPVLWTFRAKFEREGYTESALTMFEAGLLDAASEEAFIADMRETFGGPSYFYMDSRSNAEKWARQVLEDIKSGKIVNNKDRVP